MNDDLHRDDLQPDGLHPDDLARLLGDAFDARAREAVPDSVDAPEPRFLTDGAARVVPVSRRRLLAPLAAAAAVVAAAGIVAGLTLSGGDDGAHSRQQSPTGSAQRADANAQPVHVSLLNSDGQTYGIGMPVIAYFSRTVTDARALQGATTVTVDDHPVEAAWYFEKSSAGRGPLEAHLRPRSYWPAHAAVHVAIRARGLQAGEGLGFDNDLTLDFRTGPDTLPLIDHTRLTATVDGERELDCAVSVGGHATPTATGLKVVMDKAKAPTYGSAASAAPPATYAQRVTYGGEYLRAAPKGFRVGKDGSGGSVLLTARDALALYRLTSIGDVVRFVGTGGPAMTLGAGYGDWTLSWGEWRTGGAVRTR